MKQRKARKTNKRTTGKIAKKKKIKEIRSFDLIPLTACHIRSQIYVSLAVTCRRDKVRSASAVVGLTGVGGRQRLAAMGNSQRGNEVEAMERNCSAGSWRLLSLDVVSLSFSFVLLFSWGLATCESNAMRHAIQ